MDVDRRCPFTTPRGAGVPPSICPGYAPEPLVVAVEERRPTAEGCGHLVGVPSTTRHSMVGACSRADAGAVVASARHLVASWRIRALVRAPAGPALVDRVGRAELEAAALLGRTRVNLLVAAAEVRRTAELVALRTAS